MTDIVEKPKPYQIADSLLEMAQDVEIGHADRLGVPAASFLRESADCISRQNDEIERLRADNERLRAQVKRQRAALAQIMAPRYPDAWVALQDARDIARAALEWKDD